jgi:hypothetical protein
VLNGLGAIFPKAALAAQALDALRKILDTLCPMTAAVGPSAELASTDALSQELKKASCANLAAMPDNPCTVWARVRPVVHQVVTVLQALVPEFPLLSRVVSALQTLSQLADSLCGTSAACAEGAAETAADGTSQILIWEDEPYLVTSGTNPPTPAQPIAVNVPVNAQPLLQIQITDPEPPPGKYATTTANFRYWNAKAALFRGANFWGPILPSGTQWSSDSTPLQAGLDVGVDFNAFYARDSGLNFFHGIVDRVHPPVTAYSGESPHVICHELGHAILDAVKPELFDAMSSEVAAFHEAFGDMSSILTALQLPTVRKYVLTQTGGRLNANSRLSQLARQLGWAIRVQLDPHAVDADCLRNASNRFFYRNPSGLPPSAPATSLSSEPHSFSRVFSGAFLDVLAAMYSIGPKAPGTTAEDNLEQIAQDAGTILIEGIRLATVAPGFYSQVAGGMIQADMSLNGGHYQTALASNFIRRGILDASAAVSLVRDLQLVPGAKAFGVSGRMDHSKNLAFAGDNEGYKRTGDAAPRLLLTPVTTRFGLTLHVQLPAQPKRFAMFSAAVAAGVQHGRSAEEEAQDFIEDLIQLGRVSHEKLQPSRMVTAAMVALTSPNIGPKTHYVVQEEDRLVLKRDHFDCGFGWR